MLSECRPAPGANPPYHFIMSQDQEPLVAEWNGRTWFFIGYEGRLTPRQVALKGWAYMHPISEHDVPNLEKARYEIGRLRSWLEFMIGKGGNYARRALMGDDLPGPPSALPTGMEKRQPNPVGGQKLSVSRIPGQRVVPLFRHERN